MRVPLRGKEWSWISYLTCNHTSLILVLLNPDVPCLCKQWRSGSIGFWRSPLIWICTACHSVCEFISTTLIKESDWRTVGSRRGIFPPRKTPLKRVYSIRKKKKKCSKVEQSLPYFKRLLFSWENISGELCQGCLTWKTRLSSAVSRASVCRSRDRKFESQQPSYVHFVKISRLPRLSRMRVQSPPGSATYFVEILHEIFYLLTVIRSLPLIQDWQFLANECAKILANNLEN